MPLMVLLALLGLCGILNDFRINFGARRKNQNCSSCRKAYEVYENADFSEGLEYVYVCYKCRKYFTVCYLSKPSNLAD